MRERLRVLRHQNFRNLWLAQSANAMGDGVVIVALALYVTDLTDSPTEVGLVLFAGLLPLVAFLLVGGVWADRLPRARVMLRADLVRAARHAHASPGGAGSARVADFGAGNTSNVMTRETWLPATPEGVPRARAMVRELAGELSLDPATTWELTLATSEAFTNAVEHGRPCDPRGILLRAEIRDGRVGVEVADCGGCFPEGGTTKKVPGEGGRGMRIIEALTDQLEIEPARGATRVRFAKRLLTV